MVSYGRFRWTNVVFAHWRADSRALVKRIPEGLTLDQRDGTAWISVAALVAVGPLPHPLVVPGSEKITRALLGYRQLNVRTYVTGRHGPGILLLETLVDSRIAAVGASLFGQPYHFTGALAISAEKREAIVEAPGISLGGSIGTKETRPAAGSLTAWLVDRWWAYGRLPRTGYAVRVEHEPWLVRSWKAEGNYPVLDPLTAGAPPVEAQVAQDVEVAIAEIAREKAITVPAHV